MKYLFNVLAIIFLGFTSCKKTIHTIVEDAVQPNKSAVKETTADAFTKFTILQGEQYSDGSNYLKVEYSELNFVVRFDSSAVYKTVNPANQADINKLLGFSDNNAQHHEYSARFGWSWTTQGLALYAYTYNNSVRSSKKITMVPLGADIKCSIKVNAANYVFTANGKTVTMPRESTTPKAIGYKLYPYFGGDELAPHTINIWLKEL